MKKSQIETYYERGVGECPSINVKCRHFAEGLTAESLNCDEDAFRKAVEYAFESAQGLFWRESAQELAEHYLGQGVTAYSAGRSAGHLIVDGLADVETWDAIAVSAWGRFVKAIEDTIRDACDTENVRENILANKWNLEGAELYNFMDRKDGTHFCIAEMKAQAIEAGFAPVVRR